jgi:hypothetical protein
MIILFVCHLLIYDFIRVCLFVCLFATKKLNFTLFLEFSNSNLIQRTIASFVDSALFLMHNKFYLDLSRVCVFVD